MTCSHTEIVDGRCLDCGVELVAGGAGVDVAGEWFERASALLAEDDPGPTRYLVESLIVDGSMGVLVGSPKKGKTWLLLDLTVAVTAGTRALGRFAVPEPGPVLLVLEESGRAALHRRLDRLVRGRAIPRERLNDLHFAANRRVKLDDQEWQDRLREAATTRAWRLIAFDPWARVKGHGLDEDKQKDVGPALDFLRELRELSGAALLYVAHTGHEGTRQRGSSDFESYYESKLTLVETTSGKRTLTADHREDEGAGPFELTFRFDGATRTLRIDADENELACQVREYLEEHPDATATAVVEAIGGRKQTVLELVKRLREGGSHSPEPAGTDALGRGREDGSPEPPFRGPGTVPVDPLAEVVPLDGNHPGTALAVDLDPEPLPVAACLTCGKACAAGELRCATCTAEAAA